MNSKDHAVAASTSKTGTSSATALHHYRGLNCLGRSSDTPSDGASDGAGCGACTSQASALKETIAALPGVREVTRFQYNPDDPNAAAGVDMDLDLGPGATKQVTNAVVEAAWKSKITPLQSVSIASEEPGGKLERTTVTFYDNQVAQYEDLWGPRPS